MFLKKEEIVDQLVNCDVQELEDFKKEIDGIIEAIKENEDLDNI